MPSRLLRAARGEGSSPADDGWGRPSLLQSAPKGHRKSYPGKGWRPFCKFGKGPSAYGGRGLELLVKLGDGAVAAQLVVRAVDTFGLLHDRHRDMSQWHVPGVDVQQLGPQEGAKALLHGPVMRFLRLVPGPFRLTLVCQLLDSQPTRPLSRMGIIQPRMSNRL